MSQVLYTGNRYDTIKTFNLCFLEKVHHVLANSFLMWIVVFGYIYQFARKINTCVLDGFVGGTQKISLESPIPTS